MDMLNKVLQSLNIEHFRVVGNKLIIEDLLHKVTGLDKVNKLIISNQPFKFLLPNLVYVKGYIEATLNKSMKLGDLTCARASINSKGNSLEAKKLAIGDLSLYDVSLVNTVAYGTTFTGGHKTRIIDCKISYLKVVLHTVYIQNTLFFNSVSVNLSLDSCHLNRGGFSVLNSKRVIIGIRNNADVKLKNVRELVLNLHFDTSYYYEDKKSPYRNRFTGSVDSVLVYGITDISDLANSDGVKGYLYETIKDLKYKEIRVIGMQEFTGFKFDNEY